MKKIWRSLLRPVKNRNYQQEAIKYAEEMEKMETPQRAPRYPAEREYLEKIQADEKITKEIRERNDDLVDNMNKITITSSGPKDRWTPTKELRTKDTEWVHRNDKIWEYGFYEPPPEKIPEGRLMFREALEILRIQCDKEFAMKLDEKRRDKILPQIEESLAKHPAMKRIDEKAFGTMWQYFRPFERKEEQYIVSRQAIDEIRDLMLGFHKEPMIPTLEEVRKKRQKKLEAETQSRLEEDLSEEDKERLERLEKMAELKAKEDLRLSQELKKLGLTNESKAPEEAAKEDAGKRLLERAK